MREAIQTELGEEVKCAACGDFWPADPDFFYFAGGKPHSWCKACYQAAPCTVAKRERFLESQRLRRAAKAGHATEASAS